MRLPPNPTTRFIFAVAVLGSVFALSLRPASADEFYKGKLFHLLIGYGSGGGYDAYGRLLARHLSEHIPGHPTIIPQNMPGAASLTALRYVDTLAPADGTYATLFDFVQIVHSLIDAQKLNLDLRKFNWIGSISEDLSVCYAWQTQGIRTLADLKKRPEVHMGLTAAGDAQDIRLKILKRLLGVKVTPVAGYESTGSQYVAMERGELDAGCGGWSSLPLDWRTEHKINVLIRLVPSRAQTMPPDVPYAGDLIANERDRSVLRLLSDPAQLGKPIVMSKAVPAAQVSVIQEAFMATLKDPKLLEDAEHMQLEIAPKSAAESLQILESIYSMPPDIVKAARQTIAN
jgi:tripartite-type tricarboxylate transporter receptor subunit TctC